MKKYSLTVSIDESGIIDEIHNHLSTDNIIDLIIQLDKMYSDWDVTEKLYKYFKEQKEIFEQQFPEEEKW